MRQYEKKNLNSINRLTKKSYLLREKKKENIK